MYQALRPLLYQLDPEDAHHLSLWLLRIAARMPLATRVLRLMFDVRDPRLAVEAFGVTFPNPIGLAAGYDKNGVAIQGLSALGFGHLEIGTVTRPAQVGNPRPRVHRFAKEEAVINSLGFPNVGVSAVVERLRRTPHGPEKWGINIGKSKDTPLDHAAEDYVELLRAVQPFADYVTVNISSPNTLGLRQLQTRAYLEELLTAISMARDELTTRVPVLVKIAPDLTHSELDDALEAILAARIDGVIATNTTLRRDGLPDSARALKGGLSGRPLTAPSTAIIRFIAQQLNGRLPIIGVGGIANVSDALEKLEAGATLVQVYTGMIYAGPGLAARLNRGLLRAMEKTGAGDLQALRLAA